MERERELLSTHVYTHLSLELTLHATLHPPATTQAARGVSGGAEFLNVDDAAAEQGGGSNKERVTTKYMTKYERARILGTRALQLR